MQNLKKISENLLAFIQDLRQMRGTNVWTFIMYGLLFDMTNNLWRPFAVVFLERLGGTEFEIALLSSLPGLVAAVVLLPGAILFRRISNQKRATAAFILISRAMLLSIAFVPMLPANVRPLLFVILVAIMNCPDSLSQTSLQNFLGVVFSGHMRGQAIALRTKFGQAIIPIVTISSGLLITFIPNTDEQRMVLYQIFFAVAFLLGIAEVVIFNKLKIPEYMLQKNEETSQSSNDITEDKTVKKPSTLTIFKTILTDKKFRRFIVPTIIFSFTWQAGWPLNSIYQVMNLQATEMWFAIFALMSGTAALFSGTFWQKILRKHGNGRVFITSAVMLTMNMFIFPLVPNVQLMAVFSLFTGFSAVAMSMSLLNGVLEAAPDENRMTYIAFFNTITSLSLFAAPFFAHFMLSRIGLINAMFAVGFMRVGSTTFAWLCQKFWKAEKV